MDEILRRDQNHITVLAGVTNDVDKDIVMLRVDPITKRLLVAGDGGGGGGWELTGNAGTTAGTNFLGTTDNIDFVIKTKNIERFRVFTDASNGSYVNFGTAASNDAVFYFGDGASSTNGVFAWNKSGTTSLMQILANSSTSDSIIELQATDLKFNGIVRLQATNPLRFYDTDNSNYVAFKAAGTVASDITWTLPTTDSTGTQALVSDGSGNLSWSSIGGGTPGGSTLQLQYNNAGAFGGMAGTSWNNATKTLSFDNGIIKGLDATGTPSILILSGGDSTSAGDGGILRIKGGQAAGVNTGGSFEISGGYGGTNTGGKGGSVIIGGGAANPGGIALGGNITLHGGANGGGFGGNGFIRLKSNFSSTAHAILNVDSLTADRTVTFQDGSGTLAYLSDITGGSPGGVTDSIQTNDGAGGFFGNANLTYDGTKFFVGDSATAYFEYDFALAPVFNFMATPTERTFQTTLSTTATVIGNPDNFAGLGQGHYICIDPFASMSGYEGFHYGVNTGSAGTYDPYVLMDYFNITMFHDVKIQFDANTPPSVERQLAYDDTQKTLALFSGGVQQNAVQCVFTQDRVTTIANTTTATSLLNTGWGSVTFPADFFVEGKTIEFEISGFMSSTSAPNMTSVVKLGSVSLATATVASANGTNIGFTAKGKFTCKTVGSTGTFAVTGFFEENKTGGALVGLVNTTTATVDTTISNAFDFTFAWGTASASNTITSQIVTLTVLN